MKVISRIGSTRESPQQTLALSLPMHNYMSQVLSRSFFVILPCKYSLEDRKNPGR